MSNFRSIDRETGFLFPPSIDDWLPEKHLARFVVEVIDGLDLSAMIRSYRGSGSASYHPALLLGLLVYGYATGALMSLKIGSLARAFSRLFARCLTRGQDARTGSGTSLTVTSGSPANINSIRSPDAHPPQRPSFRFP